MVTGSRSDALKALAMIEATMEPASAVVLNDVLMAKYISSARKKEESEDRQALLWLYVESLSALPGDLVLAALRNHRGTFFPALDEIRLPVERSAEFAKRREMIRALGDYLDNPPPPPRTVNNADRAKVRAGFQKLHDELSGKKSTGDLQNVVN